MQHLAPAYRVSHLRGYDMFPHTPHVEALAVLDAA
jgi:tRNA/tmRNA/rRNA uracil-C5-methylase (TrmA/RlmC/RlmD family)